MTRPRSVLDTNVLVSALLWQGKPGRLIEAAGEQRIRLCTSRAMLDELEATLNKKKLARAGAVVTGDDDLLVLERFEGIAIIGVQQALALLESS